MMASAGAVLSGIMWLQQLHDHRWVAPVPYGPRPRSNAQLNRPSIDYATALPRWPAPIPLEASSEHQRRHRRKLKVERQLGRQARRGAANRATGRGDERAQENVRDERHAAIVAADQLRKATRVAASTTVASDSSRSPVSAGAVS